MKGEFFGLHDEHGNLFKIVADVVTPFGTNEVIFSGTKIKPISERERKDFADAKVANSLYERAKELSIKDLIKGLTTEELQILSKLDKKKKDFIPPDVEAAKQWLAERQKEQWQWKKIFMDGYTTGELEAMIEAYIKEIERREKDK